MLYLLSVVPIIIPSDPGVRAEVANSLCSLGDWMIFGFFLGCVFSGFLSCVRGVIRLFNFLKIRFVRKE